MTVFDPTESATADDAAPEATDPPFTVTLEPASDVVGVTVIEFTLLATLAEYEVVPDANDGDKVPSLRASPEREESSLGVASSRLTVSPP